MDFWAPKSIETDMEKLHMKFSALNVDFDSPSLDFLRSRKPVHEGIKERYPCNKSLFYRCWPVFCENCCRWAQRGEGDGKRKGENEGRKGEVVNGYGYHTSTYFFHFEP